jgi:hypothetical protein
MDYGKIFISGKEKSNSREQLLFKKIPECPTPGQIIGPPAFVSLLSFVPEEWSCNQLQICLC